MTRLSARGLTALCMTSASLIMVGSATLAKDAATLDAKTIALTKANAIDHDLDVEHREISELSRALVKDGADMAGQLTPLSDELQKRRDILQTAKAGNEAAAQKERLSALRDQLKTKIADMASQVKSIQDRARQLNSRYANLAARDVYKIKVQTTDAQGQTTKAIVGHPRDDIEFAFQRDEIQSAALIANTAMDRAWDAVSQAEIVLRSTSGNR